MIRPTKDNMLKTLNRLLKAFTAKSKPSMKKKIKTKTVQQSSAGEQDAEVESLRRPKLQFNGLTVESETLINEEFVTGMTIVLPSSDPPVQLTVVVNPPIIKSLGAFPRKGMTAGYPIVADSITDCQEDFVDYFWTVEGELNYPSLSTDKIFTPLPSHVGLRLKLFCSPWRYNTIGGNSTERLYGRSAVYYFSGVVQSALLDPFLPTFRSEYCSSSISKANNGDDSNSNISATNSALFRVVSYNILAETYAIRDNVPMLSHSSHFSHMSIEPQYLETEYRAQRILAELIAYNPDIICLQECEKKLFDGYFRPYFEFHGYTARYSNKCAGVVEGCACFTRNSSLRVLQCIDVPLKNCLRYSPYLESCYAIRPDLRDIIGGKIGSIAQFVICRSVCHPTQTLVLANTHLFYHPVADFIRLHQTHAVLSLLHDIKAQLLSQHDDGHSFHPIVLADAEPEDIVDVVAVDCIEHKLDQRCGSSLPNKQQPEPQPEEDSTTMGLASDATTDMSRRMVSCIAVGDFNSTSDTAAIELALRFVVNEN